MEKPWFLADSVSSETAESLRPARMIIDSLRSAFQLVVQTRPGGQNKPAVALIAGERAES